MKRYFSILPVVIFLIALFVSAYLFTLPGKELSAYSWSDILYLDKIAHISIFFTLCYTAGWALEAIRHQPVSFWVLILIALLFVSYGIGVEFYQENSVEGRSFEVADIFADAIGCLLFLIWSKAAGNKKSQ